MLEIHFINVGDGDAILLEEVSREQVFRVLVDAGNRSVDPAPDSLRLTAGEYLRSRGIGHIDALVITHLHSDHFCGLEGMEEVTFRQVYAGFFPPCPGQRGEEDPAAEKTLRGMAECLNWWSAITEKLTAAGTPFVPVHESIIGIQLTGGLRLDLLCDSPTLCAAQRRVWTEMLRGAQVPETAVFWASKYRNTTSLRVRVTYGGRRVELPGDCIGRVWEDRAQPCDIFKAPHHGDCKALTPALVERLRPRWSVISCQSEYVPRKDRPSEQTVELLHRAGSRVWFTDCYPQPGQAADRWTSVDFTILEDGRVLTPDGRENGGR